jgi:hypothetical protein
LIIGLGFYPPPALANIKAPPVIHAALAWIKRQTPYLDPNDILPIALELSKVAITCGNPSTPTLLVAECHRAEGTFGIVQVGLFIIGIHVDTDILNRPGQSATSINSF